MIKHVMISTFFFELVDRFSDGIVFCETNEDYNNQQLQSVKMKVKTYFRQVTPYINKPAENIRQVENTSYNIFYKISSFVIFSIIVEHGYPLKLVSIFLDSVAAAFFDEAKTILGANDLPSRLQSIEGSHYFIKFDRIIKQKKKQYDDPKSMKNTDRMKKDLESIKDIMKQNMTKLDERQRDLEQIGTKAKICTDQARKFEKKSKNLKWNLWFKKNLVWIVLVLTIIVLGWLII